MSVFDSDFLFDLPSNPEEAFLVFERDRASELAENRSDQNWYAELTYLEAMKAFLEIVPVRHVPAIEEIPDPEGSGFKNFYERVRSSMRSANLKIRLARSFRTGSDADALVVLTDDAKEAIRKLVASITQQVDQLAVTPDKKRQLIKKLHSFSHELDQELTHTEAFFSFVAAATKAAREAGAELKPLTDRIDRVLDMLEKAQKWADRLPDLRPKKQIEGPKGSGDESAKESEEMPF
jgi:hypothetical protein